METLRRKAFPAPSIVPTAAGDTLLVLEGDFLEIQAYIEHTQYDHQRMAHFDVAARTLAHYHQCVEGFTSVALQAQGELYSPAIVRESFTNLVTVWELARDPALAGITRQLEVHAADLESCFARHGELPHLVIHGDYYADNLLIRDDQIVGVVDYDKARWQARVAELAEALIYFASPRPGHLLHLVYPGFLQWELFSRFLHHYAGGVDLAEAEAHALPDYIRAIWLSVPLQRLAEKGRRPSDVENALGEVLALADWAKDNGPRMLAAGLTRGC